MTLIAALIFTIPFQNSFSLKHISTVCNAWQNKNIHVTSTYWHFIFVCFFLPFLCKIIQNVELHGRTNTHIKKRQIFTHVIKTNYEMNPEHTHASENPRNSATIDAKFLLRSTVTSSVKCGETPNYMEIFNFDKRNLNLAKSILVFLISLRFQSETGTVHVHCGISKAHGRRIARRVHVKEINL
jgi:hypothetical protein